MPSSSFCKFSERCFSSFSWFSRSCSRCAFSSDCDYNRRSLVLLFSFQKTMFAVAWRTTFFVDRTLAVLPFFQIQEGAKTDNFVKNVYSTKNLHFLSMPLYLYVSLVYGLFLHSKLQVFNLPAKSDKFAVKQTCHANNIPYSVPLLSLALFIPRFQGLCITVITSLSVLLDKNAPL